MLKNIRFIIIVFTYFRYFSSLLNYPQQMSLVPNTHTTDLNNFLPICKLGEGAFSTVYKVKRITDGEIYALKKIKMQKLKPKEKQNSLNQIRILASLKSKFIITYKQAFYDHNLNLLCIVMEYANNGDLHQRIQKQQKQKQRFKQEQIWKAASEILIGLLILHQKNILHRDLKSANVFISNNQYKLGDLNVSKINRDQDQMAKTQTGTPYYASPEVWRDELYNSKCDIWSFGCLLYEVCCFEPPFQGQDLDQLYQNVQKGKYRPIPSIYSQQLASLIEKCLTVSTKQRPRAQDIIEQFSKIKWKFMQSVQNNQIQISNNMLNTIKLPFDLRDLTKSLPIPEYKIQTKNSQNTISRYQILQKKQAKTQHKSIQKSIQKISKIALPEKVKQCLDQSQRKLIKRPVTSIKTNHMIIRSLPSCQQRPSTAVSYMKRQQTVKRLKPVVNHQCDRKSVLVQNNDKKRNNSEMVQNGQKRKIGEKEKKKTDQASYKSRCSSPSNSVKNKKRYLSSIKKIKNGESVQNKGQPIIVSNGQKGYIGLDSLQKISYEKCRENSLRHIDSLQKKVKYMRDHRRQRKYLIQQNKQNNSTIIKRPDVKFKKIFEINNTKVGLQKERFIKPIEQIDHLSNIRRRLQARKQNLHNPRYVVSAEGKRQLTGSRIQKSDKQKISNDLLDQIDVRIRKAVGIIRKVPVFPQRLNSSRLPTLLKNSQSVIMQNEHSKYDIKSKLLNNQADKSNIMGLISDNETILRLKKRIKNRILCESNNQDKIYARLLK